MRGTARRGRRGVRGTATWSEGNGAGEGGEAGEVLWGGGTNFDLWPLGSRGKFHPLVFDLEIGNFSLSRQLFIVRTTRICLFTPRFNKIQNTYKTFKQK